MGLNNASNFFFKIIFISRRLSSDLLQKTHVRLPHNIAIPERILFQFEMGNVGSLALVNTSVWGEGEG